MMKSSIFTLSFLLFSGPAASAGFYITEVGTPASLGTAGVANPTNTYTADASWSNPAGMTELEGEGMLGGFQVVLPNVRFDSSIATGGGNDGGNAGVVAPIPSFFYAKKYSDRLSFGISAAGLMGGGVDYGDNFVGRYATISAELSALGVSPSFGYKVSDDLSVGAGVSIVYTLYETDIGIRTLGPGDGKLKIEDADDFGYQPFFSLNYHLSDQTLFSAVYRAEMDVELEGDVKVKNVAAPIGANKVDIDWDNPQWLELGIRHQYTDKDTLFFNLGWQDWSAFSGNQLAFSGGFLNPVAQVDRNWKDTWHGGVAYKHLSGDGWGYSMGFSYDSSPVDDKDRTFDLPVDEIYKLAASYLWKGGKNLDFSIGGTLYMVGDAEIDTISQGIRAQGEFDENIMLFLGGTFRYIF